MHRRDGPPQTSSPATAVVEPHGREPTSAALPCPNARLLLRTVDELTERTRRADDAHLRWVHAGCPDDQRHSLLLDATMDHLER